MKMMRAVTVQQCPPTSYHDARWRVMYRERNEKPVRVIAPIETGDGVTGQVRGLIATLMAGVAGYGAWDTQVHEITAAGWCQDGDIYVVSWDHDEMRLADQLADMLRGSGPVPIPAWATPPEMTGMSFIDILRVLQTVVDNNDYILNGDSADELAASTLMRAVRAREVAREAIDTIRGRGTPGEAPHEVVDTFLARK